MSWSPSISPRCKNPVAAVAALNSFGNQLGVFSEIRLFCVCLVRSLGSCENFSQMRDQYRTAVPTTTFYGVSFLSFPTSRSFSASLVGWASLLYSLVHILGLQDNAMAPW